MVRECGKSNAREDCKITLEQRRQGILSTAVRKLSQKKEDFALDLEG